jgi:hypothetical protein
MIALSPQVRYVLEPFRTSLDPCSCGAKFDCQFQYITDDNGPMFYDHLKHAMGLSLNTRGEPSAIGRPLDALRLLRKYASFLWVRASTRTLVKDPIAVFSTEWLAKTYDMQVIVMIRHPAAFASSIKQFNWSHPFSHFLEQPLLMRDHLWPFEGEIREYARRERCVLDQAILLWRLIYSVVDTYREAHHDWIFLRHEDLAQEPLHGFQALFERLNLSFSGRIRDEIWQHSRPSNPCEPQDPYCIERDSRATISTWRERLTGVEIDRVRSGVGDVSGAFYSQEDW